MDSRLSLEALEAMMAEGRRAAEERARVRRAAELARRRRERSRRIHVRVVSAR
jgi:hypothetical protein